MFFFLFRVPSRADYFLEDKRFLKARITTNTMIAMHTTWAIAAQTPLTFFIQNLILPYLGRGGMVLPRLTNRPIQPDNNSIPLSEVST